VTYLERIDHRIHSAAGVRCCGGTDPRGHGLSATIPTAPEAAVLIGGLRGEWDRGRRTLVEGKIERRAGGPLVERPQLMSKSGSAMPGQSGSRSKCRGRSLAGAGTASTPIIMRAKGQPNVSTRDINWFGGGQSGRARAIFLDRPSAADSEPFRTPVPIESVHRFRRFRTPVEETLVAAGAR